MDARPDAYFINLLQDGVILENHYEREPQDEFGFTYANPHVQVFTQPSQTPTQKGSTPKRAQRGGKFTIEEDKLLVSAYLNVSLDAVQGNDQKLKTYWRRVWDYFHEHMPLAQRSENSLMNRWSTIQLSVNKLCGCFAGIEAKHQSGMNEEDKVSEANKSYKELHGGSFQFEHCWNILKYQPKWHVDVEKKKPKKNKTWTVPSSSTPELVDLGECEATFVDLERPIGTKAEKKKRKLAEIPSSPLAGILIDIKEEQKKMSDKKMDIIQQLHVEEQERHQLDKERLREEQERNTIKKEKLRMKQFKEEERIMLLDTSALPHVQQEYYQSRQMEILQEREKRFKRVGS
ncbi:glutathione S-transferase T3-like [Rhododendron vialii]|uniref:glutathione S-transferase T3-like n=1 Tax=Rhododendron vialii TaxID=182163 RepID=UPI00265EC2F6|nr:glutathione S-transferase T3-like [Rhododendron vialii]